MDTTTWTPLNTDIETHVGLAYGANIKGLIELDYSNNCKKYITRTLQEGQEVLKSDIRKQWEVDGEPLVQVARYGGTSEKIQCYVKKYGLLDNATLYGAPKGELFVRNSEVALKQQATTQTYVRTSVYGGKTR